MPDFGGYVAKLDGNGHVDWAVHLPADNSVVPVVEVRGVAEAPDGSIYATGRFTGTPRFGAAETWDDRVTGGGSGAEFGAFVAKLGENGSVHWLRLLGGEGHEVCVHDDSSATVLGRFPGSTIRAGGYSASGAGSWDRFLLRVAPDGSVLGLKAEGTADNDLPYDLAAYADRSTISVGSARQTTSFEISHGVIARTAER